MATVDGGTLVGRVLQEQNVKHLFAINGGHTFPILANLTNHGIKLIHMRHEQATAYAADAYARTTGRPGVCCVTAGCGLTNAVTGLCVAGLTNSAVVCLSGQHPTLEDGIGSFQEAYGSEICRTFAKYTKRVLDWPRITVDLRQAFREAMSPPQGVALVEIPTNVLYNQADEQTQFPGAKVYDPDALRSQADPRAVAEAVALTGARRAASPGRRRRSLLVESGGRIPRAGRADADAGLRSPRRPGSGAGRPPAGSPRRLEEAVYGKGRRRDRCRLPLLERREIWTAANLERPRQVCSGRSDADAHRLARARRDRSRRRPEACATAIDR